MSAAIDNRELGLIIAGGAFCLIGAVGILRMPDFYTRVHAASVTDVVGSFAILLGLALQAGASLVTVKLLFIAALIFFTSPAATTRSSRRRSSAASSRAAEAPSSR